MSRSSSDVSSQNSKKTKTEDVGLRCDVFIQCALYEEAKHTYDILVQHRGGSTGAVQATFPGCQYCCLVADVTNHAAEKVRVLIGWQPNEGLQDATAYCTKILPELETRYWIMTGILAGLYEEVQCGDVIVAKRASSIGGKLSRTLAAEARPFEASSVMVNWAKGMAGEPNWHKYILPYDLKPYFETTSIDEDVKKKSTRKLPLPMYWCLMDIMHRLKTCDYVEGETGQQRAFRMCANAGYTKERFGKVMEAGIGLRLFNHDGQLTEEGMQELKAGYKKDNFTDFSTGSFPRLPRDWPKVEVEVVVSTEYVRKDLNDPKIVKELKDATAQRKVKGADMEISAFYQALNDEHRFQKLAVKGVCDWGDMYKDDEFHQIAAEHSAAFVLEFIKRYVRVIKVSGADKDMEIEGKAIDDEKNTTHVFESLSEETQKMFTSLLLLRRKTQEIVDQYEMVLKEAREDKDLQNLLKELTSTHDKIKNRVSAICEGHKYNPALISDLSSQIDSTTGLISSSLSASSSFKIKHEGKEFEFKAKKPGTYISKSFLTDIYGSEEANSVWKAAKDKAKAPVFTLSDLPQVHHSMDILTSLTGGMFSDSFNSSSISDFGATGWSDWHDGSGSVALKYQYNKEQNLINFQVKGSQTYTFPCSPDKYQIFATNPNCTSYNKLFQSKRK